MLHILKHRTRFHLLNHVDRVVDHGTIGPQRDIDACARHGRGWLISSGSNGFAGRSVDNARPALGDQRDVDIRTVYAVGKNEIPVQDSKLRENLGFTSTGLPQGLEVTFVKRQSPSGMMGLNTLKP